MLWQSIAGQQSVSHEMLKKVLKKANDSILITSPIINNCLAHIKKMFCIAESGEDPQFLCTLK